MAATYDLSTDIGKVRLRIPDTNVENPLFSDGELQALLESEGGDSLLAAAGALEIIAGDPQRLASWSRGAVSAGRASPEDLRRRAVQLRSQATGGIVTGTIERSDFW